MECSLAVLVACFSWSNLYVNSDLVVFDQGVQTYSYNERAYIWRDNQIAFVNSWDTTNSRANNPYGRFSIGYEIDLGGLVLGFQAEHTSSVTDSDDRGVNGLAIKARWYPFRH
jgi:hypothetical protein